MNISIWFDFTDGPWGGGNQFLKALFSELVKKGHKVTKEPKKDTDVVLLNSHNRGSKKLLWPGMVSQLRQINRYNEIIGKRIPVKFWIRLFKRSGPILVHRLDGVAELIRGKRTYADDIQPAINALCDHTIFQSEYCRSSFAQYNVTPHNYNVIKNGIDSEIFYPTPHKKTNGKNLKLVAVSWSDNPRKGFAELANISEIDNVELTFIGRWAQSINKKHVNCVGIKKSYELADIMRKSDGMVHAAINEPCSNAILESLACGLPVIYKNSGGNEELAGDYGIPLSRDLHNTINTFRDKLDFLREKVIQDNGRFSIGIVADKYIQVFKKVYFGGEIR